MNKHRQAALQSCLAVFLRSFRRGIPYTRFRASAITAYNELCDLCSFKEKSIAFVEEQSATVFGSYDDPKKKIQLLNDFRNDFENVGWITTQHPE